MFPRYGRENRRYKVKAPKEKMSFEKKIKLQCTAMCILLSAGVIMSFFNLPINKEISKAIDITYDYDGWVNTFKPAVSAVKSGSEKIVAMYSSKLRSVEKRFGIDTKSDSKGTAKASSKKASDTLSDTDSHEVHTVTAGWSVPVKGQVTSGYGIRVHPVDGVEAMHGGVDIAAAAGEGVYAASPGKVAETGYDDANGNYVKVRHGSGITTFYAHLSKVCVNEGDSVSQQVIIGEVGSTGISTGPHLHFEIQKDGECVNPADYVTFEQPDVDKE